MRVAQSETSLTIVVSMRAVDSGVAIPCYVVTDPSGKFLNPHLSELFA